MNIYGILDASHFYTIDQSGNYVPISMYYKYTQASISYHEAIQWKCNR